MDGPRGGQVLDITLRPLDTTAQCCRVRGAGGPRETGLMSSFVAAGFDTGHRRHHMLGQVLYAALPFGGVVEVVLDDQ